MLGEELWLMRWTTIEEAFPKLELIARRILMVKDISIVDRYSLRNEIGFFSMHGYSLCNGTCSRDRAGTGLLRNGRTHHFSSKSGFQEKKLSLSNI